MSRKIIPRSTGKVIASGRRRLGKAVELLGYEYCVDFARLGQRGRAAAVPKKDAPMPQFAASSGQVQFSERAGTVPVFLLHAGAGSGRQWTKVIGLLDADHRALAPDAWGFGGTAKWAGPKDLSHDDQADLVLALADHLGIDRFHLVGHSYGGASAARLAIRSPERLKSLMFIEPVIMSLLKDSEDADLFHEYNRVASGFIEAAAQGTPEIGWQRFIDYRNGAGTWEGLSPESKARFLATTDTTVDGYKSNLQNTTTRMELSRIPVQTLILCGNKTTRPDRRVTEIVRDSLPHARYALLDGAEHMSPLSHPHEVAAHINAHVHQAAA